MTTRWLGLLAGENKSDNPTDERNAEQDVDDDNSRLVRTVSSDGGNGGQEIYVQNEK
jgi:hypothetical protein